MRNVNIGARIVTVFTLAMTLAMTVSAQDRRPPNQGQTSYNAIVDNLDMIVENYCKFLGRKYELTEEQYQYTLQLVRERAYGFLEKHEPEVRESLERMFEVRAGGDMQPQELMDWGKKVTPLYEEAKKIITQSNDEWRAILTDDQKKKHDADLKEMEQSFHTTDDQMRRIASGEMSVAEFKNPNAGGPRNTTPPPPVKPPQPTNPGHPVVVNGPGGVNPPPLPAQPPNNAGGDNPPGQQPDGNEGDEQGDKPENPPIVTPPGQSPGNVQPSNPPAQPGGNPNANPNPNQGLIGEPAAPHNEGEWERYVREFIERFKLNEQQQQQANGKLKECKERADQIRMSKKSDIEAIDQKIAAVNASSSKDKAKEVAELNKQKDKFNEPINKIFDQQLKPALEKLPTRTQRKEAEAAAAKSGKPATSRPGAPGAKPMGPTTTRPATPQPGKPSSQSAAAPPKPQPAPAAQPENKPPAQPESGEP